MFFKSQTDYTKTMQDKLNAYDEHLQLQLLSILQDLNEEEVVHIPVRFRVDTLHTEYFLVEVISMVENTSLFARRYIECHIGEEELYVHNQDNLSLELAFSQILLSSLLKPIDKFVIYGELLAHEVRHPKYKETKEKLLLTGLAKEFIATGKRYTRGIARHLNKRDSVRLRTAFASHLEGKPFVPEVCDTRNERIAKIHSEAEQELGIFERNMIKTLCS
jgi:hypothetical protein